MAKSAKMPFKAKSYQRRNKSNKTLLHKEAMSAVKRARSGRAAPYRKMKQGQRQTY